MKLVNTIIDQLPAVSKWQQKFFKAILTGFLGITGKLNFRNMSRYLLLHEKTISRQFAKFFPFLDLNTQLIKTALDDCTIIAFDQLFIPKAGKGTEGRGSFWNGSEGRAARGLEFALIAIVSVIKNIAYPLHARQTRDDLKSEEESRIDLYIKHIAWAVEELRKRLNITVTHILVDSFFYKEKFVSSMLTLGVHVVSKMRIDARLRHTYSGQQKLRGRKRRYTTAVDWSDLKAFDVVKSEEEPKLTLYTAIVNSIVLGLNVRVVYLVKLEEGKEFRAILYSTDTSMSALNILQHYKARFQIEFVIRDAKQHTGLMDCQSLAAERLEFHVNTSFTALNVAKVADTLNQQQCNTRSSFSMLNHKVRNHNEMMIQSIFSTLGLDLPAIKSTPAYEELINIGTIAYRT
jgi:hypothetical protein